MEEDLAIINSNTRKEKIKNFFIVNKKIIFSILILIIIIFISVFFYQDFNKKKKIKISNIYNSLISNYSKDNKTETTENLIKIIEKKNKTYSPLALYFIIDNSLIEDTQNINNLFDILIKDTDLNDEIKNLVIYKKALFNSDITNENELLQILKPIINSQSIWKSHALYLLAEYFFNKNEYQKAKDLFTQILELENANFEIKIKSQKRLNRDLK